LKQFALIQMNMGREVCRRLREADNRLFSARMGTPEADIEHVFLARQRPSMAASIMKFRSRLE
jgi:hypothetical protein